MDKIEFVDLLYKEGSDDLICRFGGITHFDLSEMSKFNEVKGFLEEVYDQMPEEDLELFENELREKVK